jgi:hypothetical protein
MKINPDDDRYNKRHGARSMEHGALNGSSAESNFAKLQNKR